MELKTIKTTLVLNLLFLLVNLALLFSFKNFFPRFQFLTGYFQLDSVKETANLILILIFLNFLNYLLGFILKGKNSKIFQLFLNINLLINFIFFLYLVIAKLQAMV